MIYCASCRIWWNEITVLLLSRFRQRESIVTCEIVVIPMNSRNIVLTCIKSLLSFNHCICTFDFLFLTFCELCFNRDLTHCWRAFDMSNKYSLTRSGIECAVVDCLSWCICCLCAVRCVQKDFHYEYTQCDSDGGRWRVSVPSPNTCIGGAPNPPVRGKGCGMTCLHCICMYLSTISK